MIGSRRKRWGARRARIGTRALAIALAVGAGVAGSVHGQRLHVPDGVAVDSAFRITVDGLRPGQVVVLHTMMDDSLGRRWESSASFRASSTGRIDLTRDAPLHGSYAGVQPMGLVTSMEPAGELAGRLRFIPPRLDSVPLLLRVGSDGATADSARVVRWFRSPDVMVRALGGGLAGHLFYPAGRERRPAVLVLGGSEGGFGGEDVAALLASRGYVALSLAYFGIAPLPSSLERIPLEYFGAAVDSLQADPRVRRGSLAALGTSKGAEAALVLGAHDPRIHAVVAYAPSAVAWSCICPDPQSPSWTLGGRPVPFVPGGADPAYRPPQGSPLHPVVNYRYRLRDSAAVRRATIPVERINGPVLLVSGREDELWPSSWSADAIAARLRTHGFRHRVVQLSYPGAGHLIGKAYLPAGSTRVGGGRLETGGTPQANAAAQADAWPRMLRFLASELRP